MLIWGERVDNNEELSIPEAARIAGMSILKFYRFVQGRVPGMPQLALVRIGHRVMVQKATLEKWLRDIEAAAASG